MAHLGRFAVGRTGDCVLHSTAGRVGRRRGSVCGSLEWVVALYYLGLFLRSSSSMDGRGVRPVPGLRRGRVSRRASSCSVLRRDPAAVPRDSGPGLRWDVSAGTPESIFLSIAAAVGAMFSGVAALFQGWRRGVYACAALPELALVP